MDKNKQIIYVAGGGKFGTACAKNLAENGRDVTVFARNIDTIQRRPALEALGVPLVPLSKIAAGRKPDIVITAVTAQTIRSVTEEHLWKIAPDACFVNVIKGIESTSGLRISEIVHKTNMLHGINRNFAVIGGGNYADEVASQKFSEASLAAMDAKLLTYLQDVLSTPSFVLHATANIAAIELAGALKNVVALTMGLITGLKLGENIRTAYFNAAYREFRRLLEILNCYQDGILEAPAIFGDWFLTCGSATSRNFLEGFTRGRRALLDKNGTKYSKIDNGKLAEGVGTAKALPLIMPDNLPIIKCVTPVFHEGLPPIEWGKQLPDLLRSIYL